MPEKSDPRALSALRILRGAEENRGFTCYNSQLSTNVDFPCHPGNRFPPLTLLTSCVSQTVMEIGFLLPNVQLPTRQCWDGAHLRPLSSHVFRALGNYFYSHKRHWHLSLLLRPFRVLFFSSPAINGCSFRIVDLSTLSFSILPTEESGNLLNLSLSLDLLYIYIYRS